MRLLITWLTVDPTNALEVIQAVLLAARVVDGPPGRGRPLFPAVDQWLCLRPNRPACARARTWGTASRRPAHASAASHRDRPRSAHTPCGVARCRPHSDRRSRVQSPELSPHL